MRTSTSSKTPRMRFAVFGNPASLGHVGLEVHRIIRAAGTLVFGKCRIGIERTRAGLRAVDEHVGSSTILDPLHNAVDAADGGAVTLGGDEEESGELHGCVSAAHFFQDAFVVVDGALGHDELVGLAVRDDDFATVVTEF